MRMVYYRFLLLLTFLFSLIGTQLSAQDAALDLARAEITRLALAQNYSTSDVATLLVSDDYTSNGIRHIYFKQSIDQISIYGTSAAVHFKDGKIIASNLDFIPQVSKRNINKSANIEALEAVARVAVNKGYPVSQTELIIVDIDDEGPEQVISVSASIISNLIIPLTLTYYATSTNNEVRLAWSLFIDEKEASEYKNFLLDSEDGTLLLEKSLTVQCNFDHPHDHSEHDHQAPQFQASSRTAISGDSTYNVFADTIESANFGGRSLVVRPWTNNLTASPNGWHHYGGIDYQYTTGNNVDAYHDKDNTNGPTGGDAARAFGGPNLNFDFPLNLNGTATDYTDASITNLFYITNVAHDVLYNYGFDEVSGNFQVENFGRGGDSTDAVYVEAQDPLFQCNANMSTPVDGQSPRMQLFLCSGTDAAYDNAVILHEYMHGVSNRLTGGPQNANCLKNAEQMGEGWSDFFGLLFSIKASDNGATSRTIGTYLANQASNGSGFRQYPYTTDMTVNPHTYQDITTASVPHGVGSVWGAMLWEMTWGLIDEYGFDPDLYNGTGGNNIALHLVIEGMKLQPCSPGFVDGRDAILAADSALYNGANHCIIWAAFAKRGLGYFADQGSANSRIVEAHQESFDMPPSCTIELIHSVDKANAYQGERLTFDLTAVNNFDNQVITNILVTDTLPPNTTFYSASEGGVLNGNVVQWPTFNLAAGASKSLSFKVTLADTIPYEPNFADSLNNGGSQWLIEQGVGTNNWVITDQYTSGNNLWFIDNASSTTETYLILKEAVALTSSSQLFFDHYFDLETNYDYGVVEISKDFGKTWVNVENLFTQNGYNSATEYGVNGYSGRSELIAGNASGFIKSIADLSTYAGELVQIRFRLMTDFSFGRQGWLIDNINITNTEYALLNYSNIQDGTYDFNTFAQPPTIVNRTQVNHTVTTVADTLIAYQNGGATFVDVQANDVDIDGPSDVLTTTILVPATNGTASVANGDSISYIPAANFLGRDTVVYQVCDVLNACEADTVFIFVEVPNFPPIAVEDFLIINENTSNHFIDVQANDSDPNGEGDVLTTSIVENALHGNALVLNDDALIYTPTADYFGLDTIIYQVCDTSNICATDTVFITINRVNEPPIATEDYATVDENSSDNIIAVQANDMDPDGGNDTLVTSIVENALHGNATVVNNDALNYTSTADYFGLDTIVYQVCDTSNVCATDTVFITINAVNQSPTANPDFIEINKNSKNQIIDVQANDSDPDGTEDTLTTFIVEGPINGLAILVNSDSIDYTPNQDFFGTDTIVYEVCDTSGFCAMDTVFITVISDMLCAAESLSPNDNGLAAGNYIAANEITSTATINNGVTVKYYAGQSITLLPGFHAQSGTDFTARIEACDENNLTQEVSNPAFRTKNQPLALANNFTQQNQLSIRPNPFRYATTIDYELAETEQIWLGLHDLTGRVIQVLVPQQEQSQGTHQYHLATNRLTAGTYWISLRTSKQVLTKKVIVLKE